MPVSFLRSPVPLLVLFAVAACGGDDPAAPAGPDPAEPEPPAPAPPEFVQVSAGLATTCAVESRGEIYCWGSGFRGRLGNGDTLDSAVPVRADFPATAAFVAVGGRAVCGLDVAGTAYCWGANLARETGTGSGGEAVLRPQPVATDAAFRTLRLNHATTCGLTVDGAILCWGSTRGGIIPEEAGPCSEAVCTVDPTPVYPELRFEALALGLVHACALTVDGAPVCWGQNLVKQLGADVGPEWTGPEPVPVQGDRTFRAIEAGDYFTCGIDPEDRVACWGLGEGGALGQPDAPSPDLDTASFEPLEIDGFRAAELAFLSALWRIPHACGLDREGFAYCWGPSYIDYGSGDAQQCRVPAGTGPPFICTATPTRMGGDRVFTSLASGASYTCGVADDRWVYCWGRNPDGALGDGTETWRTTPVPILAPESQGTS